MSNEIALCEHEFSPRGEPYKEFKEGYGRPIMLCPLVCNLCNKNYTSIERIMVLPDFSAKNN